LNELTILGWREWVALPELGIEQIKAKVDTGARTSALHAFDVTLNEAGDTVLFKVHPLQRNTDLVVEASAPLLDQREVRDSGGHSELRYVIETVIVLGGAQLRAEMTLTDRDSMGFRMLLGRTALRKRYLVNPDRSYLVGRRRKAAAPS
jgi:hypothetical protein